MPLIASPWYWIWMDYLGERNIVLDLRAEIPGLLH